MDQIFFPIRNAYEDDIMQFIQFYYFTYILKNKPIIT